MNQKEMEDIYSLLTQAVHNVLAARGINDVQVEEIQFKVVADRHLAIKVLADCPLGTQPTYECVQLPGGGVSCRMVCKKAS